MRRLLVPEVVQTSAMDCGPASLKALLEGFGIPASYGRLREACQTDVDGTSIDTIETTAVRLGLDAEQVIVPMDHLFEPEAANLPALLVVRRPNAAHHFVVVWWRYGSWLQVMDPAVGRRWVRVSCFLKEVYEHVMPVADDVWREWAGTESFLRLLEVRLRRLKNDGAALISAAIADAGAGSLARLDAAVRLTEHLAASGAIAHGAESARMVEALSRGSMPLPAEYWSAQPGNTEAGSVLLRGAVLVHVKGKLPSADAEQLSPELAAALREKPSSAVGELWRSRARDGAAPVLMLLAATLLAAAGSVLVPVLLRAFYDVSRELTSQGQRTGALAACVALLSLLVLLEWVLATIVARTGRRIELRLRVRFLYKIPRLPDRYFRSRPASDMAERAHNIHQVRQAPELASIFLRSACEMALTLAAIGWLYPSAFWPSLAVALAALGIPLAAKPVLAERDLKLRSHAGALARFNLDALLGLTALRAHGAERAVRSEQSSLLGEWARTGFALQRTVTWVEALQMAVSLTLAAWVVWRELAAAPDAASALLLIYWVLNLPTLGLEAAAAVWQYPMLRNTVLRFVEPLGAPEEPRVQARHASNERAAHVNLDRVTVVAGGHRILEDVSLDIPAGAHVGIVGRSGAGKSSLVGLLLGWYTPASGRVLVDGEDLDPAALDRLRAGTAWVDPQVQLWNRSLYQNLTFGNATPSSLEGILADSDLAGVVERLPNGMQSSLGEGGGLVSGGEGQRVRLGRAMARSGVRLAILDEPGRGLDRGQRRRMVEDARSRWRDATLLCITHDVGDTMDFDRVLVIEHGRIVEDGSPRELSADPSTRYRQLLNAESIARRELWGSAEWRGMRLANGQLREGGERREYARAGR
jgi:ATP-binding cassette subfamily B protein